MTILRKILLLLRDKSRDHLVKGLNSLGVQAVMAERNRAEETIAKGILWKSLGIIDVEGGAIRWVNIIRQRRDKHMVWRVILGIPDETISSAVGFSGRIKIKAIRKRNFPLFGRVLDVSWHGEDYNLGLISALSHDAEVRAMVMKIGDIELESYIDDQLWVLKSRCYYLWNLGNRIRPTHSEWSALQKIAGYLLPPRGRV